MTFSIETGIFRIYYDYKNEASRKAYLGTICTFVAAVSICISFILNFAPSLSHWLFPQIPFDPYFHLAINVSLLSALLAAPRVILQVEEKALNYSILTVLQTLITIGFIGVLVIKNDGGAVGYLNGVLWANVIVVPVSYIMIRQSLSWSFDVQGLIESIKFSLPVFPGIIFSWILNASDRAVMGRSISNELIGVYSLGWKYSTLLTLATSSIGTALAPSFYRLMNSSEPDSSAKVSGILENATLLLIGMAYINSVIGSDAVRLFAKPEFQDASTIVIMLCGASVVSIFGLAINLQFYQKKKSYLPVIFLIAAGISSVSINRILVPMMGIFAPPLTLLFVNSFLLLIPYHFAQKVCPIKYRWSRTAPLALGLVALRVCVHSFASYQLETVINYSVISAICAAGTYVFFGGRYAKAH